MSFKYLTGVGRMWAIIMDPRPKNERKKVMISPSQHSMIDLDNEWGLMHYSSSLVFVLQEERRWQTGGN